MSRKIVLIDGNSLVYRAFYALPTTLSLESGQVTNAVYGFTSMLIRLLIDEQPMTVAVAFDSRGPTWRHGHFEGYKANREATPNELISQMPLVKEVLSALRVPIFELPGHEADDILATLAAKAANEGDNVLVVTGDKDSFQLIRDGHVKVMTTRRGITDIVIYDREKLWERYGVAPEQIPDFLGLKGDPSDNIPGVPGVGDKTAAKLLQQFGSIENMYENLDEIKSEKLRLALGENREQAEMSKQLAALTTDLPLDLDPEAERLGQWDNQEVREVFSRLQFKTLLERFEAKIPGRKQPAALLPVQTEVVKNINETLEQFAAAAAVGLEIIRDNHGQIAGIALAFAGESGFQARLIELTDVSPLLGWLTRPELTVCAYDIKDQFQGSPEVVDKMALFDVMIAAYLLAPSDTAQDLKQLCERYLKLQLGLVEDPLQIAGSLAAAALALAEPLKAALEIEELTGVYTDIELPLVCVLTRMEATGVGLDRDLLKQLGRETDADLGAIANRIYEAAGEEFNINSPQQVSRILFDKLGLVPIRRTKSKSAYATDAAVLAKLADQHEIVSLILDHRELAKLKSTYIDALPKMVGPATGRLHTSFNQAITATGRLSSSNPNLQNIPTRSESGKRIREAFVPAHRGEKLLTADYSQIELRLLAHVSDDRVLKQAFREGVDIHDATAAEVFGVPRNEVGPDLRRRAKAINFGIVYGISPYGLSQQLDIPPEEAKEYIDLYFHRYPQIKEYIDRTIKDAYRLGYVKTITGRKRYVPELKSASYNQRSFGERVAMNAPLQGSAADIIKIAMIDIDRWLMESGLQSRMVLQVHDELIFEVPPLEEAVLADEVGQRMRHAFPLTVPLEVNMAFGRNWGEAK
jgi:DNA polymerase-1